MISQAGDETSYFIWNRSGIYGIIRSEEKEGQWDKYKSYKASEIPKDYEKWLAVLNMTSADIDTIKSNLRKRVADDGKEIWVSHYGNTTIRYQVEDNKYTIYSESEFDSYTMILTDFGTTSVKLPSKIVYQGEW